MNTKIKQTIALFFTVMLLFVLVLPPLSAAADASPIKVGYYEDGDYMSKSQSGEYSGYNIEYLQKISKQSGLPFEMVDIASWNAAYDMLVKGEIDLLPAVYHFRTAGRGNFLFRPTNVQYLYYPKRSYE